jgi:cell division protein FtsW (lipid II flippase)
MWIDRRIIRYFDWQLFAGAAAISLLGLVVLYSAGYDPDTGDSALARRASVFTAWPAKQALFLFIGYA